MTSFSYRPAIVERFPSLTTGVIRATGLTNEPSTDAVRAAYRAEQDATLQRLQAASVSELSSVTAWRRVFTDLGVKPTQHRVAVEALLRRLAKHGDVPSINLLVDVGNLVSLRHAVPVAAFDPEHIAGRITVRPAVGDERFTELGATTSVAPNPGEVIFVDDHDEVCARRWCWRQSARSAVSVATTDVLYVIEAHHDAAVHDVRAAVSDLAGLLERHRPGSTVTTRILATVDELIE